MGADDHRQQATAATVTPIPCGIITISDTRTLATDSSGQYLQAAISQAGHHVVRYELVRDEPDQIAALVQALAAAGCKVIITSGGTGITRRDSTFEAIDALLDKRLPGFGEIFRMLSFEDVGPAAMLSRAVAGTYQGTLIFCLPGSQGAVQLAMERLILPELAHLVWETIRQ